MNTKQIMEYDLSKKPSLDGFITAAFLVYGLQVKRGFIEQYISCFSGVDESEIIEAIKIHINSNKYDAPVQALIRKIIESQAKPDGESFH